jgi:hypothetical protein
MLMGCSHSPEGPPFRTPAAHPQVAAAEYQTSCWWKIRFRMAWAPDSEPDWAIDALLAHVVIQPVLSRHHPAISLWRFHRRVKEDAAGRQFSFLFYTTPTEAAKILDAVVVNPVLQSLISRGSVATVVLDDINASCPNPIEATSDSQWPPALQKAWPYYIMGVSAMWLKLLDEFAKPFVGQPDDLDTLLAHYVTVHQKVVTTWEENGQHAFFHHISAIFGYEPLVIQHKIKF